MTFEQRKQERQALIEHLLAQDWNSTAQSSYQLYQGICFECA